MDAFGDHLLCCNKAEFHSRHHRRTTKDAVCVAFSSKLISKLNCQHDSFNPCKLFPGSCSLLPPCLMHLFVHAEWAPAGPTVRTGKKLKKKTGASKMFTGGVKGPACERTANFFFARHCVSLNHCLTLGILFGWQQIRSAMSLLLGRRIFEFIAESSKIRSQKMDTGDWKKRVFFSNKKKCFF